MQGEWHGIAMDKEGYWLKETCNANATTPAMPDRDCSVEVVV